MDRQFVISDEEHSLEISRAAAYALESSGYIVPAPSTAGEWRFRPADDYTWQDVMIVLKDSGLR